MSYYISKLFSPLKTFNLNTHIQSLSSLLPPNLHLSLLVLKNQIEQNTITILQAPDQMISGEMNTGVSSPVTLQWGQVAMFSQPWRTEWPQSPPAPAPTPALCCLLDSALCHGHTQLWAPPSGCMWKGTSPSFWMLPLSKSPSLHSFPQSSKSAGMFLWFILAMEEGG